MLKRLPDEAPRCSAIALQFLCGAYRSSGVLHGTLDTDVHHVSVAAAEKCALGWSWVAISRSSRGRAPVNLRGRNHAPNARYRWPVVGAAECYR
jgi:hypothetical protein